MTDNDRTPPHDTAAEQSVLGAMLMTRDAIDEVTEILTPGDFYKPAHETVYGVIVALHRKGEPVDPVTVVAELQKRGELARIGGAPYIHDMLAGTPTASNVGYYARIVAKLATRRRVIQAGTRIVDLGYAGEDDDALVETARAEVDACGRSIGALHLVADTLAATIDSLESPEPPSVPTPWHDLNHLIGGWRPGGFYVVGARPAVGKSLVALGAALGLAHHGGVAWQSLEMPEPEVHERALSALSGVLLSKFKDHRLDQDDWAKVAPAAAQLAELPISVDDRPSVTVTDIRSHARSLNRKHPLAAVIVDYVQLMSAPRGDRRDRHVIVGEFSRELKKLAMEMRIPVIALSQLNRASELRQDKRPTMADLRESGSIEQDADVVVLLHVEEDDPTTLHAAVAKNRHGDTGTLRLLRRGHIARLDNYAWEPSRAIA